MSCCGHDTRNPTLARDHPSRNFREGKFGALPRDYNVTIADEFHTAAKAHSIHGGDERFGKCPPSGNARETRVS